MTEVFAIVGVFVVVIIAVILLGVIVFALIGSIREWLRARNEIVRTTKYLADTQQMLMTANNELNRRLTALESEVRDD
jgi:predicted PurR-regulated permease PerM